jgi:hypothetical protein
MYQLTLFCHKILHLRHLQHIKHCGFHEPSRMMTMTTNAHDKTNLSVHRLEYFGGLQVFGYPKWLEKETRHGKHGDCFMFIGCAFGFLKTRCYMRCKLGFDSWSTLHASMMGELGVRTAEQIARWDCSSPSSVTLSS